MQPEARRESVTLARAKPANLLVGWNTYVMWSSGFIVSSTSYIFIVPPNASHYSRYRSRKKVRKNLALKFCYSVSDCQKPTVVRRRSSRGSYIISRVVYFSILMREYFGRLHYCNFRFLFLLNLDNDRYGSKENFAKICKIKWNWIIKDRWSLKKCE